MSPGKVVPPEQRKGYKGKKIPIFCKNIQSKRLELGMSQEELAKLIGIDRPRISQIEAGRFPRDEDRIISLAKALNVDINWLFGFEPTKEFPESNTDKPSDDK